MAVMHTEVDEAAVARACWGDGSVRLGMVERRIAVRRLTEAGLSSAAIGEVLGLAERSVVRLRAANRRAA